MGPDTLVGIILMMTGSALAPAYAASRVWWPIALVDQAAAGAIMWFGGDGLMMALGGRWIASGDASRRLGPWLDRIRNQTVLGADSDSDIDIDDDAALDAYNTRLAALHGRVPQPSSSPPQ
jgi:putative membrane protein